MLVFGIDETLERRWGRRLRPVAYTGMPSAPPKSHFVKVQRPEVDVPDAARPGRLGRADLGTSLPDGLVPVGTLPPEQGKKHKN